MPAVRANPAAGVFTSCWTGSFKVSTAEDGWRSLTICRTASTVYCPCPKTPRSDTTAKIAGNSDSTE